MYGSTSTEMTTTGSPNGIDDAIRKIEEREASPTFKRAVQLYERLAAQVGVVVSWDVENTYVEAGGKRSSLWRTVEALLTGNYTKEEWAVEKIQRAKIKFRRVRTFGSSSNSLVLLRTDSASNIVYHPGGSATRNIPLEDKTVPVDNWHASSDFYWLKIPWYARHLLVGSKDRVIERLATPHLEAFAKSLGMKYDSQDFSRNNNTKVHYRLSHPERLECVLEPNVVIRMAWVGVHKTLNRAADIDLGLEIQPGDLADELSLVANFPDVMRFAGLHSFKLAEPVTNYITKGYVPLLREGFAAVHGKD